jgi:hypothetical protein
MPSCLDPENAETVVVIVEGNALDETGENFLGRWFLLRLHVDRCIIGIGAGHRQSDGISKSPDQMLVRLRRAATSSARKSSEYRRLRQPGLLRLSNGSGEADGDDTTVAVPVARLTANDRASD